MCRIFSQRKETHQKLPLIRSVTLISLIAQVWIQKAEPRQLVKLGRWGCQWETDCWDIGFGRLRSQAMRSTTERDVLEDLELIGVHTPESYYPQ